MGKIYNLLSKKVCILIGGIILIVLSMISIIKFNISWDEEKAVVILDMNGNEYYRLKYPLNTKNERESEILIKDNWFADSVLSQTLEDLIGKGYSEKKAIKQLNKGSLIIKSTVDPSVQKIVDEVYKERSTFTERKKGEPNQSSIVITDYKGNIRALAGANSENSVKNRATVTPLKIASTIKPVSIYTPAIEDDLIHFSSIIDDSPGITYVNGQATKWPQNHDNRYDINVTITEALQKSKNTIAVNVGELVGKSKIFSFLNEELGYSTLVENDKGDSDKQLSALSLGYLMNGITLDELVASYSMFGNQGKHSDSRMYTTIKYRNDKILLENYEEEKQVISSETATIMNRLLLNNINGEEAIAKEAKIPGIEILGKTGTIGDNNKNTISQLFVGMTPEYIGGVWVGHENNGSLQYNSYKSPISIWKKVFEQINLEKIDFTLDNNVLREGYCEITGELKSVNCKRTSIGYYKPSNIPKVCNKCN